MRVRELQLWPPPAVQSYSGSQRLGAQGMSVVRAFIVDGGVSFEFESAANVATGYFPVSDSDLRQQLVQLAAVHRGCSLEEFGELELHVEILSGSAV